MAQPAQQEEPRRRRSRAPRRTADGRWEAALRASADALPNEEFPARALDIADASEQEAAAFRYADSLGLGWRSRLNARTMQLSYELRRGGNRPGPSELWERFDSALETLGSALGGSTKQDTSHNERSHVAAPQRQGLRQIRHQQHDPVARVRARQRPHRARLDSQPPLPTAAPARI